MWFIIHITSLFAFFCPASTSQNRSFVNESTSVGLQDIPRVRLTNDSNWEGSGLVEVFMNGQWGRVCDYLWDFYDAEVVCRQLGYPGAEQSTCCGWYFGRGAGPPLMARVACTGKERSLFNCSHVGKTNASCSNYSSAGVICKLNRPNVRLVGSPLAHAGFVQIRYYGRWGSLCDRSWGPVQGHVVCRGLGYRRAFFTTVGGVFDPQSGPTWVRDAKCNGDEPSIFNCDLKYVCNIGEVHGCDHTYDGGVICEGQEPGMNETAAVRLQGSNFTHMGRVEIQQHGLWHSVCSIAWDKHDADVVCRQLGFPEAVLELAHDQFGSSPGPMWLTSVNCQGNETSLDRCVSAGWELETDCWKRYGAGVICKTDNVTGDGDVRIIGFRKLNSGRVEVKLGGVWGAVSELDWDIHDGHVVCRQLGYHQAIRVYWLKRGFSSSWTGLADLKIWLKNLHCRGNETNLLECPRDLNYDLTYDYEAGVECTNNTNYRNEREVRLVGMDTPSTGYVNIKLNGTWGAIWPEMASKRSAEVICRQLGQGLPVYNGILKVNCTRITGNFWVIDLLCHGFEDSIDQCPLKVFGKMKMRSKAMCLSCHPVDTNMTALSTTGPTNKCPSKRCRNGGSCVRMERTWKCHCLETFAGKYCAVNVASDPVSIILKTTLDEWNSIEFKRILAEILTSHCRLKPCLDEKNMKSKSQQSLRFQSDDVIIFQGYPKELMGTDLLFVRLAIVSNDDVIPRESLSQLLVKVAPEIQQQMGHGVVYIDRAEVHSGRIAGRNSDEPRSVTSHKYALIALGVVLGVVSLVTIVMIILYCRKTKRKKVSLQLNETNTVENVPLVPL